VKKNEFDDCARYVSRRYYKRGRYAIFRRLQSHATDFGYTNRRQQKRKIAYALVAANRVGSITRNTFGIVYNIGIFIIIVIIIVTIRRSLAYHYYRHTRDLFSALDTWHGDYRCERDNELTAKLSYNSTSLARCVVEYVQHVIRQLATGDWRKCCWSDDDWSETNPTDSKPYQNVHTPVGPFLYIKLHAQRTPARVCA